jgi:hypothetical protein
VTAPSASPRYHADLKRRHRKREAARVARDAERARETAAVVEQAVRSQEREVRVVRVGGRRMPLGVLAGTDRPHPYVADGHTGTTCQLCFGWSNDFRHWPYREGADRG